MSILSLIKTLYHGEKKLFLKEQVKNIEKSIEKIKLDVIRETCITIFCFEIDNIDINDTNTFFDDCIYLCNSVFQNWETPLDINKSDLGSSILQIKPFKIKIKNNEERLKLSKDAFFENMCYTFEINNFLKNLQKIEYKSNKISKIKKDIIIIGELYIISHFYSNHAKFIDDVDKFQKTIKDLTGDATSINFSKKTELIKIFFNNIKKNPFHSQSQKIMKMIPEIKKEAYENIKDNIPKK